MTAFAPGGRLWTRRSGYSSYSLFLRLRPRRRNRRPCITFGSLWSCLLFGIVPRPHHHHGPSRSHLSHRPLETLIPPTAAASTLQRAVGSASIYLLTVRFFVRPLRLISRRVSLFHARLSSRFAVRQARVSRT